MGTIQQAKEKSIEPIEKLIEKKNQAKTSLESFYERNQGQKVGIQVNFSVGPEHICIGLTHPDDTEKIKELVIELLKGQIEYFEDVLENLK